MAILVQKFGGTSVATPELIMNAARRAIQAKQKGYHVIVVVSARGKKTDELIRLAKEVNPHPPGREMDMLLATGEQESIALMAMAIDALGAEAVSFTGPQIGIMTDGVFSKARIVHIDTKKLFDELRNGRIVIVAGFQGASESNDIVTLGRGGSDTTAVALAAAVGAEVCEIYTDVDGVYTADPRIVPTARKIDEMAYDEMLELASLGAGVLQSRSVELAKNYNVRIRVRSSFSEGEGTVVCEEVPGMEDVVVRGAAVSKDEAKITLRGVPDEPGMAARIFGKIAQENINVDMIVQNVSEDGTTDLTFTVMKRDLPDAVSVVESLKEEVGARALAWDDGIAKLSVVGVGMRSHTGVAQRMFHALAKEGINIEMISTSEIKISCVVQEEVADRALRAVHDAFDLGENGLAEAAS